MIQQIERQFVRTTRPLYGHLVNLLESAISRGDLPSGSRVPPERELDPPVAVLNRAPANDLVVIRAVQRLALRLTNACALVSCSISIAT